MTRRRSIAVVAIGWALFMVWRSRSDRSRTPPLPPEDVCRTGPSPEARRRVLLPASAVVSLVACAFASWAVLDHTLDVPAYPSSPGAVFFQVDTKNVDSTIQLFYADTATPHLVLTVALRPPGLVAVRWQVRIFGRLAAIAPRCSDPSVTPTRRRSDTAETSSLTLAGETPPVATVSPVQCTFDVNDMLRQARRGQVRISLPAPGSLVNPQDDILARPVRDTALDSGDGMRWYEPAKLTFLVRAAWDYADYHVAHALPSDHVQQGSTVRWSTRSMIHPRLSLIDETRDAGNQALLVAVGVLLSTMVALAGWLLRRLIDVASR